MRGTWPFGALSLAFCALLLIIAGCSSAYQCFSVESDPSGASVYDEDGKYYGETPCHVCYKGCYGYEVLILKKRGYADTEYEFRRQKFTCYTPEDYAHDGVHPTRKGYDVMKTLLLNALTEIEE